MTPAAVFPAPRSRRVRGAGPALALLLALAGAGTPAAAQARNAPALSLRDLRSDTVPPPPTLAVDAAEIPDAPRNAGAGPASAIAGTPTTPPAAGRRRPVLPAGDAMLRGEVAERTWTLYLTREQARGGRLRLGYQNSIFVAPESSQIDLRVNGTLVASSAIASPTRTSTIDARLSPEVLRAGWNTVTVQSRQQHRTDCTLASTYALWTRVDQARTAIRFRAPAAMRLDELGDLRALGQSPEGTTRIAIIAPALQDPRVAEQVLELVQYIARASRRKNLSIRIRRHATPEFAEAELRAVVGTARRLGAHAPPLPGELREAPVARFIQDDRLGSVLVVAGPDRDALETAVQRVNTALRRPGPADATRPAARLSPPSIAARKTIPLRDLGVATQESSARRFTADFEIDAPADLYASAYGKMHLKLDAAHSADVLPESFINISVNGQLANTVPIAGNGGRMFEHFPVAITMRNFHPGTNTIEIAAALRTRADAACAPHGTEPRPPRFALFDTSELVIPDFARAIERPDLAAFAGAGAPYAQNAQDTPLVIDVANPQIYSATATLLAKLAAVSGTAFPVAITTSQGGLDALRRRDAIFVGAIADIAPTALRQAGIDPAARRRWTGAAPAAPGPAEAGPAEAGSRKDPDESGTDRSAESAPGIADSMSRPADGASGRRGDLRADWVRNLDSGAYFDWLDPFMAWCREFLDLTPPDVRLTAANPGPAIPGPETDLVLAQGVSPSATASWTILATPDADTLADATHRLTAAATWSRITGRLATLGADDTITTYRPLATVLSTPPPFSLANMRLITANLLSRNLIAFALFLLIACALLGITTARLLQCKERT